MKFEPGQKFQLAAFSVGTDDKTPLLKLVPLDGDPVMLTASDPNRTDKSSRKNSRDNSWVFASASDSWPQTRCTVRIISDIRLTILFEQRSTARSAYRRKFELGLTRAGARLASGNTGERECIVTGGLGTIKVAHLGKTYYVCCEGCKLAFDEDPAGTIEAWRARRKDAAKDE